MSKQQKRLVGIGLGIVSLASVCAGSGAHAAGLEEVLDVERVSQPRLSRSGNKILYVVSRADWSANRYDEEIYVSGPDTPARQVTDHKAGSAWAPQWSPDGRSFAYLAADGSAPQIYLGTLDGAPPKRLTDSPAGVMAFEWSPDGRRIALAIFDAPPPKAEPASKADFRVLRSGAPRASLWLLDVASAASAAPAALRRLTGQGETAARSIVTFSVHDLSNNFAFSPDGSRIAFAHAASLNILDAVRADISVVEIATGRIWHLGETPNFWDEAPSFSPDGRHVVYSRLNMADFLSDNEIVLSPATGGAHKLLRLRGGGKDTALGSTILLGWAGAAIHVLTAEGVEQHLHRVDPASGRARRVDGAPSIVLDAKAAAAGDAIALLAMDHGGYPEIYLREKAQRPAIRLSSAGKKLEGWPAHKIELVSWTSADGIKAEGVLYTPADVKSPAPLVVVPHGGPRDVARPTRLPREILPVEHWLQQGAVVLFPNYRGSIGYGERFRRLTLTNIGHAEAIDIDAGVDALVKRGLVDGERVGIAGHSWGGYLSAFLATTSRRYRAAIVVSGITDNVVNYALSNAGVAELGYLQSSPWRERHRWLATSPIGHVAGARTPTLILHGEDDRVVPVENAQLLDRALADVGVPVRTVVYGGTGHSDFRPEERRAALQESIAWFDQYLFGSGDP